MGGTLAWDGMDGMGWMGRDGWDGTDGMDSMGLKHISIFNYNDLLKKILLWRYTRRPYAEAYAEGLARRCYAEVLREAVFQ